jgi:hypothetical protein
MSPSDNNSQHLLVTHAVLTGLTPLVPIPFLDDHLYAYFMRSLVQHLGVSHARPLTADEATALVGQPSRSAWGCLGTVLLYPLKKVLRKVFFFLEWKRAVDTISDTYHQGYLIDVALHEGWLDAHSAARVRAAIDAVLARTNTSLVTRAIFGVVGRSKSILRQAGELLTGHLSGNKQSPGPEEVARVAARVEEEEKAQLGGLINQVQRAIAMLPVEHFQFLQQELSAELSRQG